MHYGDVGKDKVTRLFKRGSARFSDAIVHESLQTNCVAGKLLSPLMHRAYPSIEELLFRMNKYSMLNVNYLCRFATIIFAGFPQKKLSVFLHSC
jgi:hypothetical protein